MAPILKRPSPYLLHLHLEVQNYSDLISSTSKSLYRSQIHVAVSELKEKARLEKKKWIEAKANANNLERARGKHELGEAEIEFVRPPSLLIIINSDSLKDSFLNASESLARKEFLDLKTSDKKDIHSLSLSPTKLFHPLCSFLSFIYLEACSAIFSPNDDDDGNDENHTDQEEDILMALMLGLDVMIPGLHGASVPSHSHPKDQQYLPSEGSTTENRNEDLQAVLDFVPSTPTPSNPPPIYKALAMGGTFDHLHPGHKILLTLAAWLVAGSVYGEESGGFEGGRIICGITDQSLLSSKSDLAYLDPMPIRQQSVISFLSIISPNLLLASKEDSNDDSDPLRRLLETPSSRFYLPPLVDVAGPTATDPSIEALLLTTETRTSGPAINRLRYENGIQVGVEGGWKALEIWEMGVLGDGRRNDKESIGGLKEDVRSDEKGGKEKGPVGWGMIDEGEKEMKKLKIGSSALRQWEARRAKRRDHV